MKPKVTSTADKQTANELKRTCKGKCKKFRVSKIHAATGRYQMGQCRCQICDIWMDHKGCVLKDGSPATPDSKGWKCKCCNFRVRRNPRGKKYKILLRSKTKNSV